MEKLIITAAITGSRILRDTTPYIPYTPEEIARSAIECWNAGASIVHIHVRDPETGLGAQDLELFRKAVEPLRKETDVVINLTTSGIAARNLPVEARLKSLELKPELASFDAGSINLGKGVFANPPDFLDLAAETMKRLRVKPEIEVFDSGMIVTAVQMRNRRKLDDPLFFEFVLGTPYGASATSKTLVYLSELVPDNAIWSVTGIGRAHLPMSMMALAMGGHIRTGMEDHVFYKKGELAKNNAQFVERIVRIAREYGRDIASPDEVRKILGLSKEPGKQMRGKIEMNVPEIRKIAVIGTGVMGPDISLGFAMAGYDVTGIDIEQAILDRAAKKISVNCQQMVEEGMFSEKEAKEIKSRISLTLDWDEAVAAANYITEAVPEEMRTKQEVFNKCGEICPENVVVASNTSSMSITEIASEMKYPRRAISTHWTIPAHLSPMVEIICGEKTSTGTKDYAVALLTEVGKKPVVCKDSPGFIHNYVQFAMVKAALDLVERQIARPEDIDAVIRNGFGLRLSSVGPIQFVDMCGLDTILNIQKYMYGITKDPVYKPSRSIEEIVDRGDLGVKTGNGFYGYSENASEKFGEQTNRSIMKMRKALKQIQATMKLNAYSAKDDPIE